MDHKGKWKATPGRANGPFGNSTKPAKRGNVANGRMEGGPDDTSGRGGWPEPAENAA